MYSAACHIISLSPERKEFLLLHATINISPPFIFYEQSCRSSGRLRQSRALEDTRKYVIFRKQSFRLDKRECDPAPSPLPPPSGSSRIGTAAATAASQFFLLLLEQRLVRVHQEILHIVQWSSFIVLRTNGFGQCRYGRVVMAFEGSKLPEG